MNSATAGAYNFLVYEPTWAIDFAPNGTRKGLRDTLNQKRYADTLETISEYGADAFYTGAIANATITALRKANGTIILENYTIPIREPVAIDYKGYKITACTAPTAGVVALAALKIFECYNSADPATLNLTTHYLDESMKFVYGERTNLGDPSFVANVTTYEANMLRDKTAEEVRAKISDTQTFNVSYYDPAGIQSLETVGDN